MNMKTYRWKWKHSWNYEEEFYTFVIDSNIYRVMKLKRWDNQFSSFQEWRVEHWCVECNFNKEFYNWLVKNVSRFNLSQINSEENSINNSLWVISELKEEIIVLESYLK